MTDGMNPQLATLLGDMSKRLQFLAERVHVGTVEDAQVARQMNAEAAKLLYAAVQCGGRMQ